MYGAKKSLRPLMLFSRLGVVGSDWELPRSVRCWGQRCVRGRNVAIRNVALCNVAFQYENVWAGTFYFGPSNSEGPGTCQFRVVVLQRERVEEHSGCSLNRLVPHCSCGHVLNKIGAAAGSCAAGPCELPTATPGPNSEQPPITITQLPRGR